MNLRRVILLGTSVLGVLECLVLAALALSYGGLQFRMREARLMVLIHSPLNHERAPAIPLALS